MQSDYFNIDTLPDLASGTGWAVGETTPPVIRKIFYRDSVPVVQEKIEGVRKVRVIPPVMERPVIVPDYERAHEVIRLFCEKAGVERDSLIDREGPQMFRLRHALCFYLSQHSNLIFSQIAPLVGLKSKHSVHTALASFRARNGKEVGHLDWVVSLDPFPIIISQEQTA
jgi:hypothetical protein